MSTPVCRLLPFAVADGPHNMAADEVLLQSAAGGTASLRFYGWSPPTVSLGYFQAEQVRRTDARFAPLPYVRRPTGGATLVHDREVTYALGLPPEPPWQTGGSWLCRMHAVIASALCELSVPARMHQAVREARAERRGARLFPRPSERHALLSAIHRRRCPDRKRQGGWQRSTPAAWRALATRCDTARAEPVYSHASGHQGTERK